MESQHMWTHLEGVRHAPRGLVLLRHTGPVHDTHVHTHTHAQQKHTHTPIHHTRAAPAALTGTWLPPPQRPPRPRRPPPPPRHAPPPGRTTAPAVQWEPRVMSHLLDSEHGGRLQVARRRQLWGCGASGVLRHMSRCMWLAGTSPAAVSAVHASATATAAPALLRRPQMLTSVVLID
jgi:hypothetical protein